MVSIQDPSISFFMPVYNEEENIQKAVDTAFLILQKITNDHEVIVIDDGSIDQTVSIVHRLQKKYKSLKLVCHAENKGYGTALKTGINSSSKKYTFYTDADSQFDITQLPKAVSLLDGTNIVIGFRYRRQDPFHRLLLSKIYGIIIGVLFNLWVKDINCSFKLFPTKVFQKMNLRSETVFIDAEMLIRTRNEGYKITELKIPHSKRAKGTSKFETGKKGVFMIVRPDKVFEIILEIIRLYPTLS